MVLNEAIKSKLLNYVRKEPRTVNDIAKLLGKSWLTADAYIKRIKDESGLVNVKVFRGGTRGALKIVYWDYVESVENDEIKKEFFEKIKLGLRKDDFDPLDIFQFIAGKKKRIFLETYEKVHISTKQNLASLFRSAEKEILCFSGNISWVNVVENKVRIIDVLKEIAEKKIPIKIICRVDIASLKSLNMLYAINKKLGREAIEIRHRRHPLRGFIIDSRIARLKEEKSARDYDEGELDNNIRIFFETSDNEWIDWLKKVFFAIFRYSVLAEKRLKELEAI